MIHTMLNITRPLIVLDCETTGTDTSRDRIVELAFQAWGQGGLEKEFRTLVNPGIPITAEVAGVHGITDAVVRGCQTCGESEEAHLEDAPLLQMRDHPFRPWPRFAQLAKAILAGFVNCDFAGKRVRFDLRMVASEMARAGHDWSYLGARIVDAERLEQLGDPRTLGHLVKKHLGEDMGAEAHTALGDVQWTTRLIAGQLAAYAALPRDLDALHAAQWPGFIDSDGKFRFVNGVATCQFGKWQGRAMKDIDKGYWDWVLGADFPAEVKALAREAKLGRFPTQAEGPATTRG